MMIIMIMMIIIIMMMYSRASLQLAGGIHRAGSLGRRGTLCQPCPRSLGTAVYNNGIKQLKRIDRNYTITIIFIIVRAKY